MTEIPDDVMQAAREALDELADLDGLELAEYWQKRAEEAERAILAEREKSRKRVEELEADAARYRWLRDKEGGRSNRWPHVTQYPYQPEIDRFKPPQIMRDMEYRGEYLDEAIDAARAAPAEQLLAVHPRALLRKEGTDA